MHLTRRGILFLLIAFIIPAGLSAQAGDSETEGFNVSIDLRLGVNIIEIVPGIPVVIGVPMSISADTVTITPQFGFLYYFDVWTDLHNSYYIPLGISTLYNPMNLGLDLMYYAPVGGTNTNHMMSTALVTEFEIYSSGAFKLLFELKFGPVFVFDPNGPNVLIMINSAFIPRYKL